MRSVRDLGRGNWGQLPRTLAIVGAAMISISLVIPSAAQATSYFPANEFHDLDPWNKDESVAWSQLLSDFQEPVVSDGRGHAFVIRVTVAPAFSYSTVVRIDEDRSGSITALSKQLPPRVSSPLITMPVPVDRTELINLQAALKEERFWTLTNHQAAITSDGVDLLLEVYDHGRYHVLYSNGARQKSVLRLTRMLLDLAHLHLPGE
jgi:hypothetical protein